MSRKSSRPRPTWQSILPPTLLLAVLLASLGAGWIDPSRPGDVSAAVALRWAPPTLTNPTTIKLGAGPTNTWLDPNRDYVIELPKTRKAGSTFLEGGRNVVVRGGYLTATASSNGLPALTIKNATGTVHLEGLLIDASGGVEADAIAINAPQATVQIQNVRVIGVKGRSNGTHSDIIQPWGGVRALRIDRLTGTSNYQGLFLPEDLGPIGSATIERVNLAFTGLNRSVNTSYLIWLTGPSTTGCDAYPVQFVDVYVAPRPGQSAAGEAVWPSTTQPSECLAQVQDGEISWPGLPSIQGSVREGTPPGGDFVPDGTVGSNYGAEAYTASSSPAATSTPAPTAAAALPDSPSMGRRHRRVRETDRPIRSYTTRVR